MKKRIVTIMIIASALLSACAKEQTTVYRDVVKHDTVTLIEPQIDTIISLDTLYITDTVIVEKKDTITITVTVNNTVTEYKYVDILSDFSLNSHINLTRLTHSPDIECVIREISYSEYNGTYPYTISYIKDFAIDYDRKCYYMLKQTAVYRYNDGRYNAHNTKSWTVYNSPTIYPCTFIID